jgi:hypothetical protein
VATLTKVRVSTRSKVGASSRVKPRVVVEEEEEEEEEEEPPPPLEHACREPRSLSTT